MVFPPNLESLPLSGLSELLQFLQKPRVVRAKVFGGTHHLCRTPASAWRPWRPCRANAGSKEAKARGGGLRGLSGAAVRTGSPRQVVSGSGIAELQSVSLLVGFLGHDHFLVLKVVILVEFVPEASGNT